MRLERRFTVPVPPRLVWDLFWDIPSLASCIPGCVGVRSEDEPQRYTAEVALSVGRFRSRFELAIEVVETVDGESVRARAQGRDRITRSTVVSDLEFHVAEDPDGALVRLANELQIFGKLGSLGHGVIARRSEDLMDEFAAAVQARLTEGKQTSAAAPAGRR